MIKKNNMINSKLLRALIFIALFILYNNNFIFASQNTILNRVDNNCIWVKNESINDSSSVDKVINFLITNNINKVFLETYSNGEIFDNEVLRNFESSNGYFNDTYISKYDTTIKRGYNPIQIDTTYTMISNAGDYFINQINSIDNIKIYAWLNMYKLWDKNFYPTNKKHFYYQCPECLESDINGRSDRLIKLDKIQSLEWEGIFLSPLHPDVNDYLSGIVKTVIDKYNFDGLLLDYVRYQNYYYGYNEAGIKKFEDIYSINPLDLNRGIISKYFGYSQSEIDSIQTIWDNYREIKITELIQDINLVISKDSLNYEILVSGYINPEESKNRWYQDWSYWLKNQLIDYIVVENHALGFDEFNYNNKILSNNYKNNYDINRIIIGFNSYIDNNIDLANRILLLRLQKFNNISLYYYEPYKNEINWYNPIYNTINFSIDYE